MAEADDEPPSADEAFAKVANETRFKIVQALWDATQAGEAPVSFSSLRERTGIRDSGQFNYHLGELVPRFVRDVDEGYELTYAGTQVVGAAVSGVYTEAMDIEIDAMPVGECAICEGTLQAKYVDGRMEVYCGDCGISVTEGMGAPPVLAVGRDREALPDVFNRHLITTLQTTARGFCQVCSGPLDFEIKQPERAPVGDDTAGEAPTETEFYGVRAECQACGRASQSVLGALLLDHPAVTSFLFDAGIDIRETYIWEIEWLFEPHAERIQSEPLRLEVTAEVDGERLVLTVDEELTVLETRRE
jgi:hypothetical protein